MQINIWGLTLEVDSLTDSQQKYIESLPKNVPSVEWVWDEMDRVWDELGLDNKKAFSEQDIGLFYGHPVWVMNGLFTKIDPASIAHRQALAEFCKEQDLLKLADYGGGSGFLAEQIILSNDNISIDIIEPYASDFFIKRLSAYSSVNFVSNYIHSNYDCIFAQDVLEHVESPLETAYEISSHVKENGYVVFANCFHPVIKCHLPSTFYLRHTFNFIMKRMGLVYVGRVPRAEHAVVFQKKGDLNLEKALHSAPKIEVLGLFLNEIIPIGSKIKHLFK